jgi:hypothetical protein
MEHATRCRSNRCRATVRLNGCDCNGPASRATGGSVHASGPGCGRNGRPLIAWRSRGLPSDPPGRRARVPGPVRQQCHRKTYRKTCMDTAEAAARQALPTRNADCSRGAGRATPHRPMRPCAARPPPGPNASKPGPTVIHLPHWGLPVAERPVPATPDAVAAVGDGAGVPALCAFLWVFWPMVAEPMT